MCVEILCRALQLLSSDEQDSDELKKGILSSIAYFLPNSQVSSLPKKDSVSLRLS